MDYTTRIPDSDKEKLWKDFASTGSISSYLRYKNSVIEPNDINTEEENNFQGGTEVGTD